MTDNVLEVRNLRKQFAGVVALDDVSMDLSPGEVHAIVGENGAGKSTLIKVITGVYQPDAGEILLWGEPITFPSPGDAQAAGIHTTYQEINLVRQMSVGRNLSLGREPRSPLGLIDLARMNTEATEVLSRYGITVDVRRPVGSHGLGTQQMIAIVRAVSAEGVVVILDEPTSSLEPREAQRLFGIVRRLKDEGVAVVYITHRLDEVFEVCDRVTVLRDGKRIQTSRPAEMSRVDLVAAMLGRDAVEVRSAGVTRFDHNARTVQARTILEASDLTRPGVLDGVSVDIAAGEIVGMAGLLGSGRTETAKAIFGLEPADEGRVSVDGVAVKSGSTQASIAAGMCMLTEDRKVEGIVPTLSVRDNLVLAALPGLSRWGFISRRRVAELVDDFVARLHIKLSSSDQGITELSGGNQQKVLLARLLCIRPKVVLLDEPTRGIDVGAKAEVQSLIGDLADDGLAVLLISSELEDVVEGSDRVMVLKDGAVVGRLGPEAISEQRIMNLIAQATDDAGPSE